ncbi:uncharacterized protein LOC108671154 [Hyalella azteca]|uniref:Uncharacterized protein LOC108671154 n=1 Tax=Hyalella azteca TaxID=294128 RepID=A0A979FJE6_HYAAZ|nr:uncharacterized protein LOC108671154 [Hyalella azteca]
MCSRPSQLFSHSSDRPDFSTKFPDSAEFLESNSKSARVSNCRIALRLPQAPSSFGWGGPLELGGRAHGASGHRNEAPTVPSFSGCIAKVHINGQLQDLGPALLSSGSAAGCRSLACLRPHNTCPLHARLHRTRVHTAVRACILPCQQLHAVRIILHSTASYHRPLSQVQDQRAGRRAGVSELPSRQRLSEAAAGRRASLSRAVPAPRDSSAALSRVSSQ